MTQRVRRSGAFPRRARAFTMIELMITMIIITIVISILVPALGGVRDTARAGSTRALMNDVISASAKFELDKRRLPGVFSPQDLGGTQNGTAAGTSGRGLSAMENILADLSGGVVATAPPGPANTVEVGPFTTGSPQNVFVDTKQIGTGKDVYFVPPPKFYVAQHNEGGTVMQQFGIAGHTAPEGTDQIPDLVDAWRQPILAWVKDDTAIAPVDGVTTFLCRDNFVANQPAAKYYWASNAAFLKATSLGRKGKDQTFVSADIPHSMIGGGVPVLDAARRLDAILGNPNYPAFSPPNAAPTHPGEGRAPLILHSAGSDGFYFGSKDKGAGRFPPAGGATPYSCHFMPPGGSWATDRWKDKNGQITIDDVTSDFDDMLATGSN